MKRLFVFLVILAFVLALGCAKQAVQPTAEPAPVPAAPPMAQVNPATEPAPAEPAAPAEEPLAPIGNRVTGTEPATGPAAEEETPAAAEGEEILLTAEKTMSSGGQTVAPGTTLYWRNKDTWPHQLKITTGSGLDTKLVMDSPRLVPESAWNFTFNEAGVFTVRDIFSGDMRMTVTVG